MLVSGEKAAKMPKEPRVNMPHTTCKTCGIALRESITGCRRTQKGPMCSDCYFKALSKHIAQNPIITPDGIE